ncbi:hypothetical protein AYI92_06705 [Shewanella xiamenensis]|nr:hypothetical protein AYI90_07090 [Shewanella xiamenensis]TVL21331.1 hypothetical protein AYI91_07780 [Shewanella xiamenensis]TVL27383.1 hypothetical protein AYI92_06705 [Shewanella xiamenensis]TVL34930.1 hypothetical protein AYI93_07320 [Shewanella xiamenensis]TVL35960.1 hypothetical protein AYI95_00350 [Shewanella xiamenensis]
MDYYAAIEISRKPCIIEEATNEYSTAIIFDPRNCHIRWKMPQGWKHPSHADFSFWPVSATIGQIALDQNESMYLRHLLGSNLVEHTAVLIPAGSTASLNYPTSVNAVLPQKYVSDNVQISHMPTDRPKIACSLCKPGTHNIEIAYRSTLKNDTNGTLGHVTFGHSITYSINIPASLTAVTLNTNHLQVDTAPTTTRKNYPFQLNIQTNGAAKYIASVTTPSGKEWEGKCTTGTPNLDVCGGVSFSENSEQTVYNSTMSGTHDNVDMWFFIQRAKVARQYQLTYSINVQLI